MVKPAFKFIHDALTDTIAAPKFDQAKILQKLEGKLFQCVIKDEKQLVQAGVAALFEKAGFETVRRRAVAVTALKDALADSVRSWEFISNQKSKGVDIFDNTWMNLWSAFDAIRIFQVAEAVEEPFGVIPEEEMYKLLAPIVQIAYQKARSHCDAKVAEIPWFKPAVLAEMKALEEGQTDPSQLPQIKWPSLQGIENLKHNDAEVQAEMKIATYILGHEAMEEKHFNLEKPRQPFPYSALLHLPKILEFAQARALAVEKLKRNKKHSERQEQ